VVFGSQKAKFESAQVQLEEPMRNEFIRHSFSDIGLFRIFFFPEDKLHLTIDDNVFLKLIRPWIQSIDNSNF